MAGLLLKKIFRDDEKRKRFGHILGATVILIHAYENYEEGKHPYLLFLIAGLIFLSIAIFHPFIEKKYPWVDGVFLVIEAILTFVIAIDFFMMGKKRLPIAYLIAGCAQLFAAFKKSKKGMAHHKAKKEAQIP